MTFFIQSLLLESLYNFHFTDEAAKDNAAYDNSSRSDVTSLGNDSDSEIQVSVLPRSYHSHPNPMQNRRQFRRSKSAESTSSTGSDIVRPREIELKVNPKVKRDVKGATPAANATFQDEPNRYLYIIDSFGLPEYKGHDFLKNKCLLLSFSINFIIQQSECASIILTDYIFKLLNNCYMAECISVLKLVM